MDILAIASIISNLLEENDRRHSVLLWRGDTLVGAVDARDPGFQELKKAVGPSHRLPEDYLSGARTVLSWFIPFDPAIPAGNEPGRFASRLWAEAYVETNRVLAEIGHAVEDALAGVGGRAITVGPPNHQYDTKRLVSDWSQRHVARLTGLGTFGLHNLLITQAGCAGRLGSLVTDLVIEPSARPGREHCLERTGGSCARCHSRCPAGAFGPEGFDRFACYELLQENGRRNADIGHVDACGKCAVGLPCTLLAPASV